MDGVKNFSCEYTNCDGVYHAKGMCQKHYNNERYKKNQEKYRREKRIWYRKHKKERARYRRQYYLDNRDESLEYQRGYFFDMRRTRPYMELGDLILESLDGKSSYWLGKQLGVTPGYVRKILMGCNKGSIKTRRKIAKVLGISYETLESKL